MASREFPTRRIRHRTALSIGRGSGSRRFEGCRMARVISSVEGTAYHRSPTERSNGLRERSCQRVADQPERPERRHRRHRRGNSRRTAQARDGSALPLRTLRGQALLRWRARADGVHGSGPNPPRPCVGARERRDAYDNALVQRTQSVRWTADNPGHRGARIERDDHFSVPLRGIAEEAVLRRHAQEKRVRGMNRSVSAKLTVLCRSKQIPKSNAMFSFLKRTCSTALAT